MYEYPFATNEYTLRTDSSVAEPAGDDASSVAGTKDGCRADTGARVAEEIGPSAARLRCGRYAIRRRRQEAGIRDVK